MHLLPDSFRPLDKVFAALIQAMGFENAQKLWLHTVQELPAECNFQTFAKKSVGVCQRILPDQVANLKGAWLEIGITAEVNDEPRTVAQVDHGDVASHEKLGESELASVRRARLEELGLLDSPHLSGGAIREACCDISELLTKVQAERSKQS